MVNLLCFHAESDTLNAFLKTFLYKQSFGLADSCKIIVIFVLCFDQQSPYQIKACEAYSTEGLTTFISLSVYLYK